MHHCYQFAHAQEERHRTLKANSIIQWCGGAAGVHKARLFWKHAFLLEVEVKSVLFRVTFHVLGNSPEGKRKAAPRRDAGLRFDFRTMKNHKTCNSFFGTCVTHDSLLCKDHISSKIAELLHMSFITAFQNLGKKSICWPLSVQMSGCLELQPVTLFVYTKRDFRSKFHISNCCTHFMCPLHLLTPVNIK